MELNFLLQLFLWSLSFYSVFSEDDCLQHLNRLDNGYEPEREETFYAPGYFRNKSYYLSVLPFQDNVRNDKACQKLGAYLVRIDNYEEYWEVINLYKKHSKGGALISGTRNEENKWVYQGTNEVIRYTNWAFGEPNNVCGFEDCIVIQSNMNYQMNDVPCINNPNQFPFVCEVTEFTS